MTDALKIAIPTNGPGGLDVQRSAHFGRSESFTIVDVANGVIVADRAIPNPPHEHGGCGLAVKTLAEAGATIAIVVGMGRGPLEAMSANGMTPLFDDQSPTPRAAVEAYLAGKLAAFGIDATCQGH